MDEGTGQIRRRLAMGAAWAAPIVASVVPAPAFAASQCGTASTCPNIAFTGTPTGTTTGVTNGTGRLNLPTSGWSFTSSSTGWTNANAVGFNTVGGVNRFSAAAEPSSVPRTLRLTQANAVPLSASCTYRIRYSIIYWASAADANLVMNVRVGGTLVGSFTTQGLGGSVDTNAGQQTINVPAGTAGAVTFEFVFAGTSSDDLHLLNPVVDCL